MHLRFITGKPQILRAWCRLAPAVAVFLAIGCAGEPKHPTWNNSTGAEQHERLMWKAMQANDWTNFERRLSATFIGVSADGQMLDRAGWLAYWKGAHVKDFSLGEVTVQPDGADMKVTYVSHFQGASNTPGGVRIVSIWQQVKTRWMLTASTLTPVQGN